LSNLAARSRIEPGDLVMRKYTVNIPDIVCIGLVIERDKNSFLTVMWGRKIEYMWDDYDLMRVE
jgi:hypothetical protein